MSQQLLEKMLKQMANRIARLEYEFRRYKVEIENDMESIRYELPPRPSISGDFGPYHIYFEETLQLPYPEEEKELLPTIRGR